MDYKKVASDIIENAGGKENIKSMTHCFTRLRFVLRDNKKADKDVVSRLEGVIQVVEASGQFQVVLGSKVNKIYDQAVALLGGEMVGGGDVVVGGAAEHQGGLGIVLLSSHAGQHLTGGEPQSVDLDAGGLLKRVEVVGHLGLGECRVDGQLVAAAGLPTVPFGGGVTVAAAAGGEHSQRHSQGKEQRE